MSRRTVLLALVPVLSAGAMLSVTLSSCSSDLALATAPDAGEVDAFVREPAPACSALPPVTPPACGTATARGSMIPGPADPGYDPDLAAKTRRFDRGMHAIHLVTTGANTEVTIANEADRALVTTFLRDTDGWDLAAYAARPVDQIVTRWAKVAGAYAGAGALADAFRYATLRDEGAACEEVERARAHVRTALEALHRAVAITGKRGVIARGYQRLDVPGEAHPTTPLFDGAGNPLPKEKNNGTWRADNSGLYPSYVWEDSCSRDMLVGWVMGMAAVWEVVANDPSFDAAAKQTLADDALALSEGLMKVGPDGYDLEIGDADGRRTFHGVLHENGVERGYLKTLFNGQYAMMSLGIMAALARISGSAAVLDYVHNDLVRARRLHEIARDYQDFIHLGSRTNYSNYNMAFTGGWLATRYLCTPPAVETMREAVSKRLYAPSTQRTAKEQGQAFYDLVAIAAGAVGSAATQLDPARIDREGAARAVATLNGFRDAPYWDAAIVNCDDAEVAAKSCVAIDGSTINLLGAVGRGDDLVADAVVPMRIRPPSNYHWRSDPYRVNGGGDGSGLFPGVDYRMAYWMGRYLR